MTKLRDMKPPHMLHTSDRALTAWVCIGVVLGAVIIATAFYGALGLYAKYFI